MTPEERALLLTVARTLRDVCIMPDRVDKLTQAIRAVEGQSRHTLAELAAIIARPGSNIQIGADGVVYTNERRIERVEPSFPPWRGQVAPAGSAYTNERRIERVVYSHAGEISQDEADPIGSGAFPPWRGRVAPNPDATLADLEDGKPEQ